MSAGGGRGATLGKAIGEILIVLVLSIALGPVGLVLAILWLSKIK
jgi:hypothetical protein